MTDIESIRRTLALRPFRVLSSEGFLFLELGSSGERLLDGGLGRIVTDLAPLESAASVVLVGQMQHVTLINLEQFTEVVVRDFANVQVLGIAPRLSNQIGLFKADQRVDVADFVERLGVAVSTNALIDRLVREFLVPWMKPIPIRAQGPIPMLLPDVVQRTIRIREELLNNLQFVDADGWAKWRGVAASKNPSAALGKYKQSGRLFAVRDGGRRDLYPIFQFRQVDAEPLPGMAVLLSKVPEEARGWPLLSWFNAENTLLEGSKPSDLIATEPGRVANAAARFYSRDDD